MNERAKILLLILLLLTLVATVTQRDRIQEIIARFTSRGLRNNNPGNIRKSGDAWLGLAAEQTDDAFFVFEHPVYGIRAMARIFKNYQTRHGLDSIAAIISRWAPPSENDTEAYIKSVVRRTGLDAEQVINVESNLAAILPAVITHENGVNPYSDELIVAGIAAA